MWKKHGIEPDKTYKLTSGELQIFLKKTGKKWFFKTESNEEFIDDIDFNLTDDVIDFNDSKVYIADKNNNLFIAPALPDKPIIIKPQSDFRLLPKSSILLNISVPIWIQLYHNTLKTENLIYEAASKKLSKTWLGEQDNGLLAYSLKIHPNGETQAQLNESNFALCPLKISNESNNTLDFQRFLLQAEHLALYIASNKIITNSVHVKYKGENIISDVNYSSHKPDTLENYRRISEPRSPEKRGALKRSFYFIKSLTQY